MHSNRSREKLAGTLLLLMLVSSLAAVTFASMVGTNYNVEPDGVAEVLRLVASNSVAHQLEIAFDLLSFIFLVAAGVMLHLSFVEHDRVLATLGGVALVVGGTILAVHDVFWFVFPAVATEYISASGIRAEVLVDIGHLTILTANWGLSVGITFMGLGLLMFGLLVVLSKPVPPWLGWIGILAGSLLALGTWLPRIDPDLFGIWTGLSAPVLLWEIGLGFWLLLKGARRS